MKYQLTLLLCFAPLAIIYIVMKLAVLLSAVNAEQDYVRKEPLRKRGPYLENPYADVDEEEEEYGDSTCLLYTSPSPRDKRQSRMPSSA